MRLFSKISQVVFVTTVVVSTTLPFSPVCEARSEYWEQRVSLFDSIPVRPGDIVFLGNSITDGGEFSELFEMENIKNRGISSDVISGVRERLDQVTRNNPAKIFLLIGINDVSHNLTADRLAKEYEQLVKEIKLKAPETRLYLQSVMPVNNDFRRYKNLIGKEQVILDFNDKIKIIADTYDAVYIDLWPALSDKKTGKLIKAFTNDGLHLLGSGYKAWAEILYPYITE